ncbi:hypothetical protein [Antrihabitans stalactiti]|uniref:Uncharacterized protein n=1 Tax=Antrihabitans stalactiti TaxID=2584121 RepID=A0A848KC31_9NOCA|nr:hypothetical protein [Antrihabitans stalactiti]NMN95246.1 hypothetical protein [Antrihabitans stalactiti]
MTYLLGQMWIWIFIAFVVGLLIGFAIALVFRKKTVDVTEEFVPAMGGYVPPTGGRHQAPEQRYAPDTRAPEPRAPEPRTPEQSFAPEPRAAEQSFAPEVAPLPMPGPSAPPIPDPFTEPPVVAPPARSSTPPILHDENGVTAPGLIYREWPPRPQQPR